MLAATGIVTQAARSIGASLEALYRLRHQPGAEGFSAAWEAAIDRGIMRLADCALERAIQGEERVIVGKNGEVVARWVRYDTALLQFLLRQRRGRRWNSEGTHYANLVPGHPVYERLKRGWEAEQARRSAEEAPRILASINDKLDLMRRRAMAEGSYVEEFPDEEDIAFLASVGRGEDGRLLDPAETAAQPLP